MISAIETKYQSLGGSQSFLGAPKTAPEEPCADASNPQHIVNGHFRNYQAGVIYAKDGSPRAYEVHGAILAHWSSLAGNQGLLNMLGFPSSDECISHDGIGRYNLFDRGVIYWTPGTGAHEVYGAINGKWRALGAERGPLGYPTSGETSRPGPMPMGATRRFNTFEHGSLDWSSQSSITFEVHGDIYSAWLKQGLGQGPLGYPTSDRLPDAAGATRGNTFEHGRLTTATPPLQLPAQGSSPGVVPLWESYIDYALADHKHMCDTLSSEGYRIRSISIYGDRSDPRYAAVWIHEPGSLQRIIHNANLAQLQAAYNDAVANGLQPTLISATGPSNDPVFAEVFEPTPGPSHIARINLVSGPTSIDAQTTIYTADSFGYWCWWAKQNNYLPRSITIYGDPADPRYAGIWECNNDNVNWTVVYHDAARALRLNLVSDGWPPETFAQSEMQGVFDAEVAWARASDVSVSADGRAIQVFRGDQVGLWRARIGLTAQDCTSEIDQRKAEGLMPVCLHGSGTGRGTQFAAIFVQSAVPLTRGMTITGAEVPALRVFDEAAQECMQRTNTRSLSLAIAKDGRLVYARAFTWAEAGYPSTNPRSLFRVGSCSKPLTAIAIWQLIERGWNGNQLSPTDRLIDHVQLTTPLNTSRSASFNQITIEQLLSHTSGLVRDVMADANILQAYGPPNAYPLSLDQVAGYMATQPLAYTPGTQKTYSNVGYLFLMLLVQQLTGNYTQYVRTNVLAPLGVLRPRPAGALLGTQDPLEARYHNPDLRVARSVMTPDSPIVPIEYGSLNFGNFVGVGGWAIGAADYVKLLATLSRQHDCAILSKSTVDKMWTLATIQSNDGTTKPLDQQEYGWERSIRKGITAHEHGGLLAEAMAYVSRSEESGCSIAAAVNTDFDEPWTARLGDLVLEIPDNQWPAGDLFPSLDLPAATV